jgi:hypothetical protein
MTLTAANAYDILDDRIGNLMEFVGKSTNSVGMDFALSWAARQLGVSVADYTSITTSEIAATESPDVFLDLAEYRLLASVLGNLTLVDVQAGPRQEKLSQVAKYIERRMSSLEARGILALAEPGEYTYIQLDLAAKDSS